MPQSEIELMAELQAHIEAMCDHYGISDVFGTQAIFIANEWARVMNSGRGPEPFIARAGLEYMLEQATRNTDKLQAFVEYARSIGGKQ